MLMKIEHLNFTYGQGTVNECPVLRDISFEIEGGEYIGLIGGSGSGKTTLMKHLNGLLKAQSGDVLFEGQSIYDKKYKLSGLRKEVGLVFQYPEQQLFGRTVFTDVCFGPKNLGMEKDEMEESARECLELVGIDEGLYHRSPFELSGGQKRCVAIAGVLAMKPKILIMDEPAAGLDPQTKYMIFDLVERIKEKRNLAIVQVSHHMEDVAAYADRILVLHNGELILQGTPQEVFVQTEVLREIGVGVPQIASATESLMKAGFPISRPAISVEEAEEMILHAFAQGKGGAVHA